MSTRGCRSGVVSIKLTGHCRACACPKLHYSAVLSAHYQSIPIYPSLAHFAPSNSVSPMPSNDQPASKRKCIDDSHAANGPTEPVTPMRSSIWYPDGNIILQAEGFQFKVHKSILAQSSSVFDGMFSIPQPPMADDELVEGCPVILLSDSSEDVEYVLQAICQRK